MNPIEAIVAHVNHKLPRDVMFREILGHRGWRVPKNVVHAEDGRTSMWAFTSAEAYQAALAEHGAAVRNVVEMSWLDEALAEPDPRVTAITIDPLSPLAFEIANDAFGVLLKLASAVRVERAMNETDLATMRAYPAYAVPYLGELGKGHQVVTVTGPGGPMIAAFTAPDAAHAFAAAGAAEDRAAVKFQRIGGAELFALAEKLGAQGVLVNSAGPHAFAIQLATCKLIAALP